MRKSICLAVAAVFVCVTLSYVASLGQDQDVNILQVPQEYPTIQAAIDDAIDWDTVLLDDGIYKGPGNKDLDLKGKAITVRSKNGPYKCIIDCENSGRGFYFHSGEGSDSVVEGVTIRNGKIDGNGAGIFCKDASPTIVSCIIEINAAEGNGGGVYCHKANPSFINCLIAQNSATANGGGLFCQQASPTLTNCTIAGNSSGSWGGGIWCQHDSPSMTNTIIWGNSSRVSGYQICVKKRANLTLNFCAYPDAKDEVGGNGTVTPSDCTNSDPLFVGKGDYHLQAGSSCIDAGNSSVVTWKYDLDGNARILDGDRDGKQYVDIGVYEMNPYWSPNPVVSDAPDLDLITPVPAGLTDQGSFFGYSSSNKTLYFFKRNEDGWEQPEVVDSNIESADHIATADINKDGLPDVYVLSSEQGKLAYYLHSGHSFEDAQYLLEVCASNIAIITPINGDLLTIEWAPGGDMGTISLWEYSTEAPVFAGNPDAEIEPFRRKVLLRGELYHGVSLLASGDVDSDNDIDAVFAKPGTGDIFLLENVVEDGRRYFVPRMVTYSAPEDLTGLIMLDANGDTYADIGMRVEASPAVLTVCINDNGCYFTPTDIPLGVAHVLDVAAVKLDTDNMDDFIVLDRSGTGVSWLKNGFDFVPQPDFVNLVTVAGTIEPTYTKSPRVKAFKIWVTNTSRLRSVTLNTETTLSFCDFAYSANLSKEVTIGPEGKAELEFVAEMVPEIDPREYDVTLDFHGTDDIGVEYSRTRVAQDKVHIVTYWPTVSDRRDQPIIIRGECEFGDVKILTNGRMIFDGSAACVTGYMIVDGEVYEIPSRVAALRGNQMFKITSIADGIVVPKGKIRGNFWIITPCFTMEEGAIISADGRGYPAEDFVGCGKDGPGAGKPGVVGIGSGGGGGFGGEGKDGEDNHESGGRTYEYGELYEGQPAYAGSAGGGLQKSAWSTSYTKLGGNGGGAIRIDVIYTATINGTITANGGNGEEDPTCAGWGSGGGSGGSIYLWCNKLVGGGTVSAMGGKGTGDDDEGDGGGGRIRLFYTTGDEPPIDLNIGNGDGKKEKVDTVDVTVEAQGWAGLKIYADNHPPIQRKVFKWIPGSTHTIGTTREQLETPGTRWVFERWWPQGGPMIQQIDVPPNPVTYTAVFKKQLMLRVYYPYGTDPHTPIKEWYEVNSDVVKEVEKYTDEHNGVRERCDGWTGTGSVPATGTTNKAEFAIKEPSSITWKWKKQYKLEVLPPDRGKPSPGTGPHWYDEDSKEFFCSVDKYVDVNDDERFRCDGWRGTGSVPRRGSTNNARVTMREPSTIAWRWQTQYKLTTGVTPTGAGTVAPASGTWYDKGSRVWVNAIPSVDNDYFFDKWTGDLSSRYSTTLLDTDGPRSIVANFFRINITMDSNNDGSIDENDDEVDITGNAYVGFNGDDDNENGKRDVDETGKVEKENDLAEMRFEFGPKDFEAKFVIEKTAVEGDLKVWESPLKEKEAKEYVTGSDIIPSKFYVEGIKPGYVFLDITAYCKDTGKYLRDDLISIYVVKPDINIDSDNDKDIDEEDDKVEDSSPGCIVTHNHDDDNKNKKPDKDEADTVAGENDLETIKLSFPMADMFVDGDVVLNAASGGSIIKVWEKTTKGKTPVKLPKTYTLGEDEIPESLYVEGIDKGEAVLEFVFKSGEGGKFFQCRDKIVLTIIKIHSIVFNWQLGATDASLEGVNIRQNDSTEIVPPEYIAGSRNCPAAYLMKKSARILVRLDASDKIKSITLEAKSDDKDGSLLDIEKRDDIKFVNGTTKEGGDDASTPFDDSLYPYFDAKKITGKTYATPECVHSSDDHWRWVVSKVNDVDITPKEIDHSGPHKVYTLFDMPSTPWTTKRSPAEEKKDNPWSDVLIMACEWAKGATDEAQAVEKITVAAYDKNKFGRKYNGGQTHSRLPTCELTNLLADPHKYVDCRDMSAVVQLFTRILGGKTTEAYQIDEILTKDILGVGDTIWSQHDWNYHQFGWYNTKVYDACLKLRPPNPGGRVPAGEDIDGPYKRDIWTAPAVPPAPPNGAYPWRKLGTVKYTKVE